ncbi:UDP-galactose transporter [Diplodia intermedia]|uniref:UDP-galactose transporter n=1 Tax=Diplodia intermedia TaxID=856260 RepID=A0ABR3TI24_9PEZI
MKHPNIELLRAKLMLMSPDDCPPAAIAATRNHFPDALKMVWTAPPRVAPGAGPEDSESSTKKPAAVGAHRRARSNAIVDLAAPALGVGAKNLGSASETHPRVRSNATTSLPAPALDVVDLTDPETVDLFDPGLASRNNVGIGFGNNQHSLAQNDMILANTGQNDATLRNATGPAENKTIPMGFVPGNVSRNYVGHQHRNNLPQGSTESLNCVNADATEADKVYHEAQSAAFQKSEVPSYVNDPMKGVNATTLLSSKYVQSSIRTTYHSNAGSGRVEPAEKSNKRICKGIVDASGGLSTRISVPKMSADNFDSSADKAANKRKHDHAIQKDGKSGLSDAKSGKVAQESDVIIISDEDNYLDVEKTDTDDNTNGRLSTFEPRYVVVDAVGWIFREVTSLKEAVGACAQVMPPIDAGNGVKLFVNDIAHARVLQNLRTEAHRYEGRKQLTGSSRNKLLMRTERKRTKAWLLTERGCTIDPEDKMWDFSPLWYLFNAKVAELKRDEQEMRRAGGGIGFGGANGGSGRRDSESAAAFSSAEVSAADVGGGGTKRHEARCSESDTAWLRFEDDE